MAIDPLVLKGLRALVVDDEDDSLSLVSFILETEGVHVIAVDSAKAALEMFEKSHPDFLVCDIAMPFQDGYSLICQVRELEEPEEKQVPAIALSALPLDESDRLCSFQHAAVVKFQAYIVKPVEPETLVATILDLCK